MGPGSKGLPRVQARGLLWVCSLLANNTLPPVLFRLSHCPWKSREERRAWSSCGIQEEGCFCFWVLTALLCCLQKGKETGEGKQEVYHLQKKYSPYPPPKSPNPKQSSNSNPPGVHRRWPEWICCLFPGQNLLETPKHSTQGAGGEGRGLWVERNLVAFWRNAARYCLFPVDPSVPSCTHTLVLARRQPAPC